MGFFSTSVGLSLLPGDSTLLHDGAAGRVMIIQLDGKPGAFFLTRTRSKQTQDWRESDGSIFDSATVVDISTGEAQPMKIGAGGAMELADQRLASTIAP